MDPEVGVGVEVIVPRGHLLRGQQLGHLAPSRTARLSGHVVGTGHRLGGDGRLQGLRGGAAHLRGQRGPGSEAAARLRPPSCPAPSPLPSQSLAPAAAPEGWAVASSSPEVTLTAEVACPPGAAQTWTSPRPLYFSWVDLSHPGPPLHVGQGETPPPAFGKHSVKGQTCVPGHGGQRRLKPRLCLGPAVQP